MATIARAKQDMNKNISNDAPYWAKRALHPVACAKKEQMETWRLDINRGFRALVDSSESLGENLMAGATGAGRAAITGWMIEWIPKMFGAHAIGEGGAALQQFLSWVGGAFAPVSEAIKAETERAFQQHFSEYYDLYQAAKDPSSYMDQLGFPPGTRESVNKDMETPGGAGDFNWRAFEPIYNTVIMSKLALLDGNGLNELSRRAGVTQQLFTPGENTNVMLGMFRSMLEDWCGAQAGLVLWRNPEAREKIFGVIFKGFGPGPGSTSLADMGIELPAAAPGAPEAAGALRLGADQTDYMREIVVVMQEKIPGVATAATADPSRAHPAPATAPPCGGIAPEIITNWGQRCCAKDIAELRGALALIQAGSPRLSGAALTQPGRRTTGGQITTLVGQLNAALDAFANTRDATTATAALASISRQLAALARMVTGT